MRRGGAWWLCAVLVMCAVQGALCGLLATAQIEQCVDNGSTNPDEAGLKCFEKVTVSLSLFGGQRAGTERLEANITSLHRSDGSLAKLSEPITIVYEKSEPLLVYPIVYKQVRPPAMLSALLFNFYRYRFAYSTVCESQAYGASEGHEFALRGRLRCRESDVRVALRLG